MKDLSKLKKMSIRDSSDIIFSNFYSDAQKGLIKKAMLQKSETYDMAELLESNSYFSTIYQYQQTLGGCPEFDDMDMDEIREGELTTLFIDLVNFTARTLYADGDIEELKKIEDLKQKFIHSCMYIVAMNNGHVHDITGDGIMAYFYKGQKWEEVNDAMHSGMYMIYSVRNVLNDMLRKIDPNHKDIRVRVGIDCGSVLWSKIGNRYSPDACEAKATGLSVDMAAKLSGGEHSWTLKIGNNIYELGTEEFREFTEKYNPYERTIDGDKISYGRHIFDWGKYVNSCKTSEEAFTVPLPLVGAPIVVEKISTPPSVTLLQKDSNKEKAFGEEIM